MTHKNKRGQLAIFIIIAIILVAAVALSFVFRNTLQEQKIPSDIQPVYNQFLTCIEDNALSGISALESQAGYIYLPDFEPGSRYMPFSSQLDFLGNPVPYWYYVSGNNLPREQVPSKNLMQSQLERFLEEEINDCDFSEFYSQGYSIELNEPNADVLIMDERVDVDLSMDVKIEKNQETFLVRNHDVSLNSDLGKLYNNAKQVYEQQQQDLILEDYAIDVLRLYAPVDGVEISCSPLTWNADEVFDDLESGIGQNTLTLKTKSGNNVLNDENDDYYVTDFNVENDVNVRFLNSENWPKTFEVEPSENSFLIAEPVGNQPGLGVLGFCYVPYHFVYDVKYPVLVQVSSENSDEIFQFPMAVILQGNNPRESLDVNAEAVSSPGLCANKNTPVNVRTYDSDLNPVNAEISYECFSEVCDIGTAESGILEADFPQCVNGYIIANADGYEETKFLFSTTQGGSAEIIMDKVYPVNVNLKLDNQNYNREAVIYFTDENQNTKSVIYPEQKTVELSPGEYSVEVYIYQESEIVLPETSVSQCTNVPRPGLGGLFGLTQEKCFDVEIPENIVSNALAGGGSRDYFVLESELENSGTIEINAPGFPEPETLEQLQDNYALFEDKELGVVFK